MGEEAVVVTSRGLSLFCAIESLRLRAATEQFFLLENQCCTFAFGRAPRFLFLPGSVFGVIGPTQRINKGPRAVLRLSRDHAPEAVSKMMDKFGYEIKDGTLSSKD